MKQIKDKLKLPDNYFGQLSEKVWKKIKQTDVYEELLSISTFVAQHLRKKNIFKLPENYFQTLPERIQQKTETKPLKIISFKRELAFMLSAVAVWIVFVFSVFVWQPQKEVVQPVNTAHIDEKMIFMALSTEQDEASLETEAIKSKEVLLAVAQSIEQQNTLQKSILEQELDLDKNLESELEKALENEFDNL